MPRKRTSVEHLKIYAITRYEQHYRAPLIFLPLHINMWSYFAAPYCKCSMMTGCRHHLVPMSGNDVSVRVQETAGKKWKYLPLSCFRFNLLFLNNWNKQLYQNKPINQLGTRVGKMQAVKCIWPSSDCLCYQRSSTCEIGSFRWWKFLW